MRKSIRLLAYLLTCSMTFSGCGIRLIKPNKTVEIKDIIISVDGGKNPDLEQPEETSKVTDETTDDIQETVSSESNPTIPEVTDEVTDSQEEIIPTTPVTEEPEITDEIKYNMAIVTTGLNVRASDSTDSLIIGSLNVNDITYRILSGDNNWDLIKTNDMIGYVYNTYLDYSAGEYIDDYEHVICRDLVLTTTDLNFRRGPSTDNEVIELFPKGTELKVSAYTNNGWLLVEYNGVFGYVHGDYVMSLSEKLKQDYPDLNIDYMDVQKVVYATTVLNIRNGISTDYDKIGQLEKYETLRVLKEYDEWYLVMTNEYQFGFVFKEYTKDLEGIFIEVDKSEQQLYMYQNNELLYTTPVTTGKDTTPADTGLFKVFRMKRDTYLVGEDYREFVEFWIQYNGGEGIHDARWRSVYGEEDYHTRGSHGCINTPRKVVEKVYQLTSLDTPVIVHK